MTRPPERQVRPRLKLVRTAPAKGTRPRAGSNGNCLKEGEALREDKIASARRRMSEGFYDRPDVLERIAEGILRQLKATPSRA